MSRGRVRTAALGDRSASKTRPLRARALVPALAGLAVIAAAAGADAYRTGPPPAHTGGFGEPSCGTCHVAGGAAEAGATLELEVPAPYQPGRSYAVRVRLVQPDLAAAGFQLSARFAEGPRAGRQAGSLASTSPDVQVVEAEPSGVQYASHTARGTSPDAAGGREWVVRWTAPVDAGPIVFHAAANAANDDDSEFGDAVAVAERKSRPAGK